MEVLRNISMIMEKASPRTIQNYVIWRFMMSQSEHMPMRFRRLKQEFNRIFEGINKEKPRKIKCGQYVNVYMGLAVSKLYISKYFDENSRKEVNRLILNV